MERKDNLSLSYLLVDCLETRSTLAQLSMGLLLPFTYIHCNAFNCCISVDGFAQFDCNGSVLEEVPFKMYEAFLLYLQGLGHGMQMNFLL